MIKILAIFSLWALPAWAEKLDCDPQLKSYQGVWKECQSDSDCVQIKGTCGFAATVNQQYVEKAGCYFENITKKQKMCIQMVEPSVKAVTCDTELKTCVLFFNKE